MAGDWIKMNKSLPRDPRVVRISSALQADRLRTIGGLLSAWCLADEQTEDGRLDAYTPELMDEMVGMPGLARAMESVGWLIIGPDFLEFPRFDEHNGKSAKRRAQDSLRKMSAREADKCPHEKRTNVRKMSALEKRREEKRRDGEEEESPSPPMDFAESDSQSIRPPHFEEVHRFAKSQPMPISDDCVEAFFDEMEALQWTYKGQPCVARSAWQARFRKWTTNWINNANGRKAAAK